jgi:hypothetical protein
VGDGALLGVADGLRIAHRQPAYSCCAALSMPAGGAC